VNINYRKSVELKLVVDLQEAKSISRLPDPADMQIEIQGITLPRLWLDASQFDAVAKLRAAVTHLRKHGKF